MGLAVGGLMAGATPARARRADATGAMTVALTIGTSVEFEIRTFEFWARKRS